MRKGQKCLGISVQNVCFCPQGTNTSTFPTVLSSWLIRRTKTSYKSSLSDAFCFILSKLDRMTILAFWQTLSLPSCGLLAVLHARTVLRSRPPFPLVSAPCPFSISCHSGRSLSLINSALLFEIAAFHVRQESRPPLSSVLKFPITVVYKHGYKL